MNMKINEIVYNEMVKVSNTALAPDHLLIRKKWLGIKKILDAIYKELPPFTKEEIQVQVNLKNLGIADNIKDSLLKFLALEEKICGFRTHSKLGKNEKTEVGVITSEPAKNYLNGSIAVYDIVKFEQFSKEISNLCNFIEIDGRERFSEVYHTNKPEGESKKFVITPVEPAYNYPAHQNSEMENAAIEERRRFQEEKQHRERLKLERILNAKEDKQLHALKTIKEYAEPAYPQIRSVSIDYYNFNYEDRMDALDLLRAFLNKAIQKGCFKKLEYHMGVGRGNLVFIDIDLQAIEKYIGELENKKEPTVLSIKEVERNGDKDKLYFYPASGGIEYKGEKGVVTNGCKTYALLKLMYENKNTPFNTEDIKKYCNSLVNKEQHKFRKEKDIDDAFRQIRYKLKVSKQARFPIIKRGQKDDKKWSWVEK